MQLEMNLTKPGPLDLNPARGPEMVRMMTTNLRVTKTLLRSKWHSENKVPVSGVRV
jgi:hypothetical protein